MSAHPDRPVVSFSVSRGTNSPNPGTCTELKVELSEQERLQIQVRLLDYEGGKKILHEFPPCEGRREFKIPGDFNVNVPVGTMGIAFEVIVLRSKSRFGRADSTRRLFGRLSTTLTRTVQFQSIARDGGRHRGNISNGSGAVGEIEFSMHVSDMQPQGLHDMPTFSLQNAQTTHPMFIAFQNLREVLLAVAPLAWVDDLALSQCGYLFAALWRYWSIQIPRNFRLHNGPSTNVVNRFKASRGNVFDDLVTQYVSHFKCLRDIVASFTSTNSALMNTMRSRTRALLKCVLRSSLTLFCWAHLYPTATYAYFEHNSSVYNLDNAFKLMTETMEQSVNERCRLLRSIYPKSPTLQLDSDEHNSEVDQLFCRALHEVSCGAQPRPFTDALFALRYAQAERVMDRIQHELQRSSIACSASTRDVLRRMLTHLAQESNCLPRTLLLEVHDFEKTHVDGGAFGRIYRGTIYRDSKTETVAMKAIDIYPKTGDSLNRLKQMYLEVLTCQSLNSEHVIEIRGIYESDGMAYAVMPFFSRGNAINYFSYIRGLPEYRSGRLTHLVHKWIYQLSCGLQYLHEEGVIHGDIRGVNLLVDDNRSLVIADFGLAVFANGGSQNYLSRRTGNAQWMAPELLGYSSRVSLRPTKKSDVYSFSHVCIELYTGQPPYPSVNEADEKRLQDMVIRQGLRPPLPRIHDEGSQPHMSHTLYSLLSRCWDESPAKRPSMAENVESLRMLRFDKL